MKSTLTPRATPISKLADVLLVDDDELLLRALSRLLTARGYTVRTTTDARGSIKDILGGGYDCVVSDISMPGMTGIEMVAVLRSYECQTPVILVTGEPNLESARDAIEYGVAQYLTKPVDGDTLTRAIARAHRPKSDPKREEEFEAALESLYMLYQPIVSLSRRRAVGYEALVRSTIPGFERPHDLLGYAEQSRRIVELGRKIRERCAESIVDLPAHTSLFINLHAEELLDPELYSAKSPLAPHAKRVVLEITERATITGITDVAARMARLRDAGYRIAVDDLGAGYAGLSSVATLEPDFVKLDMSLTRDLDSSSLRSRLVGSLVLACSELQMQLVAEGVETMEDVRALMALRCDLVQGYYYGRPAPSFESVAA